MHNCAGSNRDMAIDARWWGTGHDDRVTRAAAGEARRVDWARLHFYLMDQGLTL